MKDKVLTLSDISRIAQNQPSDAGYNRTPTRGAIPAPTFIDGTPHATPIQS